MAGFTDERDNAISRAISQVVGVIMTALFAAGIFTVWGIFIYDMNGAKSATYFSPDKLPGEYVPVGYQLPRIYYSANLLLFIGATIAAGLMVVGKRVTLQFSTILSAVCAGLLIISGIVGILLFWVSANKAGAVNNIANDKRYCCVPEFYANPVANGCPSHIMLHSNIYPFAGAANVTGCTISVAKDDLTIDLAYILFTTMIFVGAAGSILTAILSASFTYVNNEWIAALKTMFPSGSLIGSALIRFAEDDVGSVKRVSKKKGKKSKKSSTALEAEEEDDETQTKSLEDQEHEKTALIVGSEVQTGAEEEEDEAEEEEEEKKLLKIETENTTATIGGSKKRGSITKSSKFAGKKHQRKFVGAPILGEDN
jgi:hypothetical protein